MFTDNVTLFNKYYDRENDTDVYLRSFLLSVDWQGARAVNVGDKGLTTADYTEIFIWPDSCDKEFIKPKAFDQLEDKTNYFTLNAGDIVVKGIIDFDLTNTNLKTLKNTYDDVLTITSVVDLIDSTMPHWEIGAK